MATISTVYANAAWPALIIMGGLRTWHAIVIGLLIEAAVIFLVVKLNPMKSILASIVINTVSTAFGIIIVPFILYFWGRVIARRISIFIYGGFNFCFYDVLLMGKKNPQKWERKSTTSASKKVIIF